MFTLSIATKLSSLALALVGQMPSSGQDHSPRPPEPAPAIQPASHYRSRNWNTDDGLPQNTVVALEQTPDGYLCIGTRFGFSRSL